MRKITKRSISILCVCIMAFFVGTIGVNANTGNSLESYQLKALGRLESDVDKSGTAGDNPEDFVYDADDLYAIENMVRTGKAQLSSSINAYKTGNVKTLDTFTNLSSAVDSLTDFPNGIYYYDATTLARYIKENDSYYLCDQFGNKTSDTAQSVDVNNLVEYKELEQENLTAGTAGMVGKSFVLGNGSDNISYRNQGYADGYTDGLASSTQNATIEYAYHSHVASCTCGGYGILHGYNHDNQDANSISIHCNKCNNLLDYATKNPEGTWFSDNWWTLYNMTQAQAAQNYKCNKTVCGKSTSTIESATITFK